MAIASARPRCCKSVTKRFSASSKNTGSRRERPSPCADPFRPADEARTPARVGEITAIGRLLALDRAMDAWVIAHRLPALNGPMWIASAIGRGGLVWLALACSLAAARRI